MTEAKTPTVTPRPMSTPRCVESLQESDCVELEASPGLEDPASLVVVGVGRVASVEDAFSVYLIDADTLGAGAWKVSLLGFAQSTIFSVGLKQQAHS